jgi:hypothetical protein
MLIMVLIEMGSSSYRHIFLIYKIKQMENYRNNFKLVINYSTEFRPHIFTTVISEEVNSIFIL